MISDTLDELRDRLAKELHVLVVMISNSWGGLEQTALNDTRMLEQHGLQVTLLIREGSPIDRTIQMESPHIRRMYCNERVRNYLDRNLWKQLRVLIDKEGVNLIHCHQSSLLGAIVPAISARRQVALVVSRHILNSHSKRDPIHAFLYRRVDYLCVLSETMRENLRATLPIREKKLRVVNLAIDLDWFNPHMVDRQELRTEWKIKEGAFLVGVVGRLDPMKGQDLLIKAMAQVRKTDPAVCGVIVGNETPGLEGKYLTELNESIRQLRLNQNMNVHGARKDVPKVMAALDLLVMPSWSEAFGLVALEAMAMGVPTILARGGSAQELAMASGAETIRPRDAYDLALKIRQLKNNLDQRREMSAKGRAFVVAEHGKEKRLRQTLDIYARCFRRRIHGEED